LIFVSVALGLFALSLIVSSREEDVSKGDGAGPGAFSRSALGCAGLYDVLRRMDLPVIASTRDPLRSAGSRGTLIVAEPGGAYREKLVYTLEESKRLLLVLPKWGWLPDPNRPEWVSAMYPALPSEARSTLALAGVDPFLIFSAEHPQEWTINEFSYNPEVSGAVQMLRPDQGIRTLVGDADGALVAEIAENDRRIWILADPDVMSNHGIGKGENAAFMVNLIKSLSTPLSETGIENSRIENSQIKNLHEKKTIVFDETVHGFVSKDTGESVLKMTLSFPFVIVPILTCISAVLLALAGIGRFGAPLTPRPPLDFGKGRLIDNSARLLDYGGHHAATLGRYVRMILNETAKALHAPEDLQSPEKLREYELAQWADRVGRSRKVSVSCASILDSLGRSDIPTLMETARLAHRWKIEVENRNGKRRNGEWIFR
jgi:hypothetical protein